ncbi:3-deoxy-D-manno-octulosonic-acid transferase [Candidatus Photodesmus katoptron]|nr:3-deoxy-D-manno-octulosonic-acid transferase [Candidatus Photodesmus katoptron]
MQLTNSTVGKRWKEYFGKIPKIESKQKPIWLHAASVGEVIAAFPFIKALKESSPNEKILITTTTSTGAEQVKNLGSLVEHRYMPIDFKFAIKNFLQAIKPKKMLIMETELWPNTIHVVSEAGIPIIIINARLSNRSMKRYKKFNILCRFFLEKITAFLCQHKTDAENFISLGILKSKIFVTGSIKFDLNIDKSILKKGKDLRKKLGKRRPIWVAVSTHPGEEEEILAIHHQLLDELPNILLILAPRHPERFNAVAKLCKKKKLQYSRRSKNQKITQHDSIYLADTMGEMLTIIGAATICFMGGSLIQDKVGGHNVLEPAILKKPILIGPNYFNFLDIILQLKKHQAIKIIHNPKELANALKMLFKSEKQVKKMGNNALKVIKMNTGAVNKTINLIKSIK